LTHSLKGAWFQPLILKCEKLVFKDRLHIQLVPLHLATALSPLMPLRSFGIFSALVIACVFFINAAVLPPLTVLYARNLMGRGWIESCKAFTCGLMPVEPYVDPGLALPVVAKQSNGAAGANGDATNGNAGEGNGAAAGNGNGNAAAAAVDANAAVLEKYIPANMRFTERFFYVRYYNFLRVKALYNLNPAHHPELESALFQPLEPIK
jgi:hypothetical protein